MEKIKVIVDYSENFGAMVEYNGICVDTADTLEEMKNSFAESFKFHLDSARADGDKVLSEGEYELEYELTVQALLQHYKSIINLSALSKVTGVNKALLSHYASGIRTPRENQKRKIIDGIHTIGKDLLSVSY